MNLVTFLDAETTGLPEWKKPSGSDAQPHIVQLAAVVCDLNSKKILQSMDVIIKPDGYTIPTETSDIHGITNELANDVGVPEVQALYMFLALCGDSLRVSHNRTFDKRIIRIATKRFCNDEIINKWHEKDNFDCTMLMSKPIMEMEPKGRFGFKNPKLIEAYKFFTGKDLVDAHSAMADTMACMDVYWGILAHNAKEFDESTPF